MLHMIEPRASVSMALKKSKTRLPFISAKIIIDKKFTIQTKGYSSFPAAIPRFSRNSNETYGRGPGMKALPDIKTENQMEKTQLQSEQFRMAPPLQATENALLRPVNYKPFGISFRKPGSDKIEPLFNPSAIGAESGIGFLDRRKDKIERHFFIPQLRTIENDRMTATEIVQRRDEQFRSLGAILIRLSKELLEPTINRHFSLLFERGAFGEVPEKLKEVGGNLKIRYTSMIARAQIVGESENITRVLGIIAPFAEADPSIMDNFDGDEIALGVASELGVNSRYTRKKNKRDEMRKERAQAQKEQTDIQNANTQSDTMKNAAGAMDGQSA